MIKIELKDITTVSKNHFDGVKNFVLKRAKFYQMVFRVIDRQAGYDLSTFQKDKTFGTRRKTALIKIFGATKKTFTKSAHYNKLLLSGDLSSHFYLNRAGYIQILTDLSDSSKLEKLILAGCDDLFTASSAYNQIWFSNETRSLFEQVISYDEFIKKDTVPYNAYDLAAVLGISTCPYCNRNFISTIIGKNKELIIRPAFDHFFSKSVYPLLALSFFNLIPSCDACNSHLKHTIEFSSTEHVNPYKEGFGDSATFDYLQISFYPDRKDPRNYRITMHNNCGIDKLKQMRVFGDGKDLKLGNVEVFKLRDVYQAHTDVIGELIVKADKDGPYHATSLFKSLPQFKSNKKEFYRFYFANYFDESDFNRRPLAKLTRDFVNKYLPEFNV